MRVQLTEWKNKSIDKQSFWWCCPYLPTINIFGCSIYRDSSRAINSTLFTEYWIQRECKINTRLMFHLIKVTGKTEKRCDSRLSCEWRWNESKHCTHIVEWFDSISFIVLALLWFARPPISGIEHINFSNAYIYCWNTGVHEICRSGNTCSYWPFERMSW